MEKCDIEGSASVPSVKFLVEQIFHEKRAESISFELSTKINLVNSNCDFKVV